jgi:hypothetical protein
LKNRAIDKKILPKIVVSGILAAIVGSIFAMRIDMGVLRKLFGAFMVMMGAWEFFKKR